MSPSVYYALCALVKDAMEVESDAAPMLHQAARELAVALESLPEENAARKAAIADMAAIAAREKSAA